MLTVVCYAWGGKYSHAHIARLQRGVARNLRLPHRFAVISDDGRAVEGGESWWIPQEDLHLTKVPGCFARLRLFDPDYLEKHDADRVVVLDLDTVITGPLDDVFDRPEPFVIFQGANAANPCPYNGSTWMLQAGYRPDVWTDFSIEAAARVPFFVFPEDQAWLAHKLPGAAGWNVGPDSGLYAFNKKHWPRNNRLPPNARSVTFVGRKDPSLYTHLDWVREHWLGTDRMAKRGILHPAHRLAGQKGEALRADCQAGGDRH